MTYGEKIQQMIEQINKLYTDAEWLRDMATQEEKEHWNRHRGIFYSANGPLKNLQDVLTESSAKRCICDNCKKSSIVTLCNYCKKNEVKVVINVCQDCGKEYGKDRAVCDQC